MGQVNSQRENRLSEEEFQTWPAYGGEQPETENGRFMGLFKAIAARDCPQGVLAEGQELSSNPLRPIFNDL